MKKDSNKYKALSTLEFMSVDVNRLTHNECEIDKILEENKPDAIICIIKKRLLQLEIIEDMQEDLNFLKQYYKSRLKEYK